ncbi:hypothetical protein F5X99DRAFT_377411 [Biscogniauxia marginata]|nr:hypothetical protein F5X99DRAFT_377411 [Biscogniauxia marginata]
MAGAENPENFVGYKRDAVLENMRVYRFTILLFILDEHIIIGLARSSPILYSSWLLPSSPSLSSTTFNHHSLLLRNSQELPPDRRYLNRPFNPSNFSTRAYNDERRKRKEKDKMCDWEEFLFVCNHSTLRLKSYCHFARNDPNHQCYGVKMLRDSWLQEGQLCDDCLASGYRIHNGIIWQLQPGSAAMQHQQQRR